MKFKVMAVKPSEYRKADNDPNYSPRETEIDTFTVQSWRQANYRLRRGLKNGKYPRGSTIVEVKES